VIKPFALLLRVVMVPALTSPLSLPWMSPALLRVVISEVARLLTPAAVPVI
jgi:hypothetical protein